MIPRPRPKHINLKVAEELEHRHIVCEACPHFKQPRVVTIVSYFTVDCVKCGCSGKVLFDPCPDDPPKFGKLEGNAWQT